MNMDDIMVSLKKTIDNASTPPVPWHNITGNIESGKGTIGRLLMDHSLARNFDLLRCEP